MAGGDIIGSAYIEVLPITSRFQQQLDAQLQRTQTTGGFQVPITGNTTKLEESIKRAIPPAGHMLKISGNTKPLEDAVTRTMSTLTRKALGIVGIISIGSTIIHHLKDAVYGFNNVIQQAQIGLETLLGSAQAADDLIEKLKVFARMTPFNFSELVKDTQTLVAMGTAAEDVIPTLTAVGDALSGLGRMSSMPRILFDLGQIRATGRLTGRELMNMAMQGIPVLKYLSEATGRTMEELREAMAKGSRSANGLVIDSATAIKAILTGMENQFGGLMVRQMGTAAGAIANWQDAEQQLLGAIGKPVFDRIISSTIGLSTVVSDMATAFAEAGKKGESGLLAVKNVFLNLFPASARATINSVLANLGKMLHNLNVILGTTVNETKQWGAILAGVVVKALQGLLNVIRPVTDFLAKHKVIVQDLVKVYIALKVIEVVTFMWTKMAAIINMMIARTIAFAGATKASTAAIVEQTGAIAAQNAVASNGMFSRLGSALVPRAPTRPSSDTYGVSAIGRTEVAAAGDAAAVSTGKFKAFASSLMSSRVGALGAIVALEGLKATTLKTSDQMKGLATITQGVAAGFLATGNIWGAALGGVAAGASVVYSWIHRLDNAMKKVAEGGIKEGNKALAEMKLRLDALHGTDFSGVLSNINSEMEIRNKALTEYNAILAQYGKRDQSKDYGNYVLDAVDVPPEVVDKLSRLKTLVEGINADFGVTGQLGGTVANMAAILTGTRETRGREDLIKMGQPEEEVNKLFRRLTRGRTGDPEAQTGWGGMLSAAELADVTGGTEALANAHGFLADNMINTNDELLTWQNGLRSSEDLIAKAIKAADDWGKAQKQQFQISHDVADANQSLKDSFIGLADTIHDKKTEIDDFVAAGKSLVGNLDTAGQAVFESLQASGASAEAAALGALSAQNDIIDSFIALMESAGKSDVEINKVLNDLGLLEQHRKITLQIDADTSAALEALTKLLAALDVTGYAMADAGALAGLAGANFNILAGGTSPVAIPGKNSPYPSFTPGKAKSGGGANAAEKAAEKAAKDLESASKVFYDTVVEAAKSFHERLVDLMGNPAERIQYQQARSTSALIRNTDLRTSALTSWTEGIAKLKSEGLSQIAIDALGLMKGPEMDRQVKRLLQSSPDEIARLNASVSNEAEAAKKAAFQQQGDIIAKAITDALAKFFADAGTTPNGLGAVEIVNNITQAVVDPDALALAILSKVGGSVKR